MTGFDCGLVVPGRAEWWLIDYAALVVSVVAVCGAVWLLKGGAWNDGK